MAGCRILSKISEGATGSTYRAEQLESGREVALKILMPRLAEDHRLFEKLRGRARVLAQISHPNLVGMYDVGRDADTGIHHVMTELVEGRSLAELVMRRKRPPPREAADHVRQAALGLACAHRAGLIHTRLHCGSILVAEQGTVKVAGFELSTEMAVEPRTHSITMACFSVRVPAYMSPEQWDEEDLDGRTDIYSLGGVFFTVLTGRRPFASSVAGRMKKLHKYQPVDPPREIVSTVPQAISDVVVKMMAKRREDRYQTMEEVAEAVKEALDAAGDEPQPVRVFISAKSADCEHAREAAEFLSSHGVPVFFSEWSLPELGTARYHAAIESALERAQHLVIVASSRENVEARWVRHEWESFLNEYLAERKSGNIITVAAGEMAVGDLPLSLRRFEVVPLSPEGLKKLLRYVAP